MTTYRVGGAAALFVRVRTLDDLRAVAAARAASGLPVLVVGRGSNLLVADTGFAGIAVSVADLAGDIAIGDEPETAVTAGGGVALPVLARRTAAAGLRGFEWAVGVPGSVGGAVRMNAGGHGSDMAACLLDVEVVDVAAAEPQPVTLAVDELGLRFRGSDLAPTRRRHRRPARAAPRRPGHRRGRDRRDRQVATGEPAGRPERRLGVRQSGPLRGERREPDRPARPARVPDRHGVGVREARQLHPGRRRRPRRRCACRDDGGAPAGPRRHRLPAAQRDPADRLPRTRETHDRRWGTAATATRSRARTCRRPRSSTNCCRPSRST